MAGGIDIYNKPYSENERAKWWKHDVTKEMNEIVLSKIPDGIFYCEQVNAQNNSNMIMNGSYHFEFTNTTIKTGSNLVGIKPLDIIKFRDEFWLIDNVQKIPVKSNLQYSNRPSYVYYLSLKTAS